MAGKPVNEKERTFRTHPSFNGGKPQPFFIFYNKICFRNGPVERQIIIYARRLLTGKNIYKKNDHRMNG